MALRPRRRRWLIAAGVLFGLGVLGDGLVSAYTLTGLAARPIVGLTRGDGADATRIAVTAPGAPSLEGEARGLGGEGIPFGYAMRYALPDGTGVTCHVWGLLVRCNDHWRAERASP